MRVTSVAVAVLKRLPRRTARNICKNLPFIHDAEFDGIRLRCHPSDNVTERELLLDPESITGMLGPLNELLAIVPLGGTFVDVGANCGAYSMFAARRVGPGGKVIAIEPLPLMRERLRRNAKLNGFENIDLIEAAAGPATSSMTIHIRPANQGQSSFVPPPGYERQFRPLDVPVRPLSEIVSEKGVTRIDALKIDVEGFEDQVLMPFFRKAGRSLWPRRVLIEIASASSWREDVVSYMLANGYHEIWNDGRDGDAMYELN